MARKDTVGISGELNINLCKEDRCSFEMFQLQGEIFGSFGGINLTRTKAKAYRFKNHVPAKIAVFSAKAIFEIVCKVYFVSKLIVESQKSKKLNA